MTGLAYRGPAGSYTDTGQAGRGPCSALAASMQPHQRDTAGWDEFGFRLESLEEGEEGEESGREESDWAECPQRRLQVTLVLTTLSSPRPEQWACELALGSASPQLSSKLGAWLRAGGVPHSLRPQLWVRLLAARPPPRPTYKEILAGAASRSTQEQIEKVRSSASGHQDTACVVSPCTRTCCARCPPTSASEAPSLPACRGCGAC